VDLFTDYSPERETRKKLTQARLTLVENECNREYFTASCAMLKERIARLESELARTSDGSGDAPSVWTNDVRGATGKRAGYHPSFSFKRAAR
jgi:uncharacterized small protein (DUF1192 family)